MWRQDFTEWLGNRELDVSGRVYVEGVWDEF